jgi:predicted phosphodiesterase
MRVALISDVHGNRRALEAVLEALPEVDGIWCLGDTVGYGPEPAECCRLVRDRASVVLAGNHDVAVLHPREIARFSPDAARAARWTAEVLDEESRRWLETLAGSDDRGRVALYHGSPRDPIWEYVTTHNGVRAALEASSAPVVVVGHTHAAICVQLSSGRISGGLRPHGSVVDLTTADRGFVNPGSIGQPRDGDARAAFALLRLDDSGQPVEVEFRRATYDIAATQREIVAAGLPQALADRLSLGI